MHVDIVFTSLSLCKHAFTDSGEGVLMSNIITRVAGAGLAGAVLSAILWVMFFTHVVPWQRHETFTAAVFILAGLTCAIFSLKDQTR